MKDDYIVPIILATSLYVPLWKVGRMYFLNLGVKGLKDTIVGQAIF